MNYNIIFEPDYSRIMFAVIIEARASIPEIKNKDGFTIKDYIESQTNLIDENTIVYKIETELGVLVGFFAVSVNTGNKTGTLLMKILRPAFQSFDTAISEEISNFIFDNKFIPDFLFDNLN